jgi:hypothetical protein
MEVMEWFDTPDLAKAQEIRLIATGKFDYNTTAGGDGLCNPSEDVRRKISLGNKGKKISQQQRELLLFYGKGNKGRSGKSLSEEHKRKISEAMKRTMAEKWGKPAQS